MMEILFLAFIAAIFCLDVTAFGQFMISRPIVCGPVIGYLLGDIKTGLWVGMIVDLIWIGVIPMGAAIPQDATAVVVLSLVWGLKAFPADHVTTVLALMLAVPGGILFKIFDVKMRYYNIKVARWVEQGVETGDESRLYKGISAGMGLFFIKAFIFFAILFYPGAMLVEQAYALIPARLIRGLDFAWYILPLAGFAVMLVNFRNGKFPCDRIN